MGFLQPYVGYRGGDGQIHIMKYLFAIFFLMPSYAHAQMTETDIASFMRNYEATYKTCNLEKIRDFALDHFTYDYFSTFKDEIGGDKKLMRDEIMHGMQETIDFVKKSNLNTSQCNTTVSSSDIKIRDDYATMQIQQTENMQLNAPMGQIIPIALKTRCNHLLKKIGSQVRIKQSECVVSQ